ncbi:MAG: hypothetical protein VXX91_02805 [Planctomycetota bacterium]|nr:hypothetical protein [Planctomycetota bacterium]
MASISKISATSTPESMVNIPILAKHRATRRTMGAPHWSETDAIVTIIGIGL